MQPLINRRCIVATPQFARHEFRSKDSIPLVSEGTGEKTGTKSDAQESLNIPRATPRTPSSSISLSTASKLLGGKEV